MKIKLSPVRTDVQLVASVHGDVLTVNGQDIDFSPIPEGATLPAAAVLSDWVNGDVSRINGEIHLTLMLPHGANAPHSTRFPEYFDKYMTVGDGEIDLPAYDQVEGE